MTIWSLGPYHSNDHPYTEGVEARKRIRNPEAHRAAILQAARATFAEYGYAKATIRQIAQRAGVTHGLVMRHFSSKEQLFVAAVPGSKDLTEVLPGPPETLAERIARAFVQRMEQPTSDDPFLAMIRSAATDEAAATTLFDAMRLKSLASYRTVLTGPDVEERVDMIGALLIGVTFNRYVVKGGILTQMPAEHLVRHLTNALNHILQPDIR
jgi:hypothetical protein